LFSLGVVTVAERDFECNPNYCDCNNIKSVTSCEKQCFSKMERRRRRRKSCETKT